MAANFIEGAVDARVVETPHGFKVVPSDVFKRSGEQFTLLNITGSTVHVSFPVLPTNPAQADISPGNAQAFEIQRTAPGSYDYWVQIALNDRSRDFTLRASAGSDPRIIIDF